VRYTEKENNNSSLNFVQIYINTTKLSKDQSTKSKRTEINGQVMAKRAKLETRDPFMHRTRVSIFET
jgi:hypothetical protein